MGFSVFCLLLGQDFRSTPSGTGGRAVFRFGLRTPRFSGCKDNASVDTVDLGIRSFAGAGTVCGMLGFIVRLILPSACTIFESWKWYFPSFSEGGCAKIRQGRKDCANRASAEPKPRLGMARQGEFGEARPAWVLIASKAGCVSAIFEQVRPWLSTCTVFVEV